MCKLQKHISYICSDWRNPWQLCLPQHDLDQPELYHTKCCVNTTTSKATWIKFPTGKGSHLIILHTGSKHGFVENAKLVFQVKNNGDYQSSIMGGIHQGAHCFAYPMTPPLAVTSRKSPCRLPSHAEWLPTGGINLAQPRVLWASPWPPPSLFIPFGNNLISWITGLLDY